ncbi:MAG: hypothetical protein WCJ70_03730 [bacterium]
MLAHIITSKTRREILTLFFHHPSDSYYLRDIVRRVDEEVNAVKRELDILVDGKVLTSERRLNKVFFTLNPHYIYYDEFMRLFAKTSILAVQLREHMSKLGKVKYLALSLKYSKRQEVRSDELYLLAVGTIVVPELEQIISYAQQDFGREINYSVMTEDELTFRKRNNDPFITKFLRTPKVMLHGSEEEIGR